MFTVLTYNQSCRCGEEQQSGRTESRLQEVWDDMVSKFQLQDFPLVTTPFIKCGYSVHFKHAITLEHLLEGGCATANPKVVSLSSNVGYTSWRLDGLRLICEQ